MINSKISIVMSCYNEKQSYLELSVQSILDQSHTNFEFIIINDSTSNENLIYLNHVASIDSRVKIINNSKRVGLAKSLNKAISYSDGDYILRMDTDDISFKDRIKYQLDFMVNNPKIDVAGSNAKYINESGEKIKNVKMILNSNIYLNTMVIHLSVIGKKSFFLKNKYDPRLIRCQDFELWIRTYKKFNITNIDKYLISYRVKKKTFKQKLESYMYTIRIIFRHSIKNNLFDGIFAIVYRTGHLILRK